MTSVPQTEPFVVSSLSVPPGTSGQTELPIARLVSGTPVSLPVLVLNGARSGPALWLSAAIHGDELCGVEVIRRVLSVLDAKALSGTVIAVPVVNVHGFNRGDRYLPDRRDLNRSFPGSPRGSLASRLANLMMTEVIARCDVGIDFHSGSGHRANLPQIRGDLDDPQVVRLASAFSAPITLHSRTRDGSLREAATQAGSTVLLYEGGEADRFDEVSIRAGADGALRVMLAEGMIEDAVSEPTDSGSASIPVDACFGERIVHLDVGLGDDVVGGQVIASIYDPFGKRLGRITSRAVGVVIAHTMRPLVNRGDAIVHLAEVV